MTDSLAAKRLAKAERMASQRLVNDSLMRDIAEHVQPRKAQSILSDHDHSSTDETDRLFDTTAMQANQTLGSGMHSNITPMGTIFASIMAPSEVSDGLSYDVRNWFLKATQVLHQELAKSNFHSAVDEFYLDHGGFGTAAMLCRMGEKGTLVFETLEIGTYSIAEGEDRLVDTLYRHYELTPRQIKQRFGDDVSATVEEKANDEKSKDVPLKILHCIEPREDYDPNRIDAENMPIASDWILVETQEVLKSSGFLEQPFAVSRWRLWGKSPYGWSPSYYALPVACQLNFLEQCIDVGVERAAFPAWMVPSSLKGEFDPRPHGQNIFDASPGGDAAMPQELQATGRLDIAVEREEQKRKVIREAFFEDLFKLLSRIDKQMTAREVQELTAEKTTLFHPFFARLTTEFLSPILKRAFAELLRAGKFGTPPDALFVRTESGWEMDEPEIEFQSRLALAHEMGEVSGILQTIEDLAQMAQVVGPQVYDWLHPDRAGAKIARTRGVSAEVMRTSDEIEEKRQAEIEAAQAEAQAQQAQQLAGAVQSLGGPEQVREMSEAI